jgi:hypothetical protein
MHVQIINFKLTDMSEDEYRALGVAELGPAYGNLPGLLAKVWLASPATNTYGGIYLWADRTAMEEYLASDLLKSVKSSPHLTNITSNDFEVYEEITRLTQPEIKVVAEEMAANAG